MPIEAQRKSDGSRWVTAPTMQTKGSKFVKFQEARLQVRGKHRALADKEHGQRSAVQRRSAPTHGGHKHVGLLMPGVFVICSTMHRRHRRWSALPSIGERRRGA